MYLKITSTLAVIFALLGIVLFFANEGRELKLTAAFLLLGVALFLAARLQQRA